MSARFACHRCDHPLQVSEGFEGSFVRCPKCGSYTSLPDAEKSDGYGCEVPFKSCPYCGKELPAPAKLCTGCLYNFTTGRRMNVRRNLRPISRHWGGNVPLRLAIAGAFLLLWAPVLIVVERAGVLAALCVWPAAVLLSAGTFRTLTLRRGRQGGCDAVTRLWLLFVPLPARTVLLDRRCMTIESSLDGGATGWVEAMLPNSYKLRIFFLPGLALMYLYTVLAVGHYALTLADDRGSRVERTVLYRCRREGTLHEIVDTFAEVARLTRS